VTPALGLAGLLVALAGSALLLAALGVRQVLGRARMHARAHAVAVTWGLERRRGHLLRDPDPLFGASRLSALDLWLHRMLPGAAWLEAAKADAGLAVPLSRLLGFAAAGGVAVLAGLVLAGLGVVHALLLGVLAAGGGLVAWLSSRRARRRKAFEKLLPEAIGLMVRGLRAGVPVSETVAEVGREVMEPVGGMFRRAHEQVRLGQPLEGALLAETRGLESQAMNFLIVTLSVQRETGGNLAETLDKLEDIMRRREQMQLKIKAMSSEARASALIIGSLPLIMAALMAMVSPDYMLPLFTTAAGNVLLAGAGLSLAIGAWLMAQLVQFEV